MTNKYITELLDEINKDTTVLVKNKSDNALKLIFSFSFRPEGKFLLPETDPPYKPDAAPIGMSPTNLMQELRRFYVFCRKDLTAVRREGLFIQLLETIHPDEAKLMLHIKNQNLPDLYPNITHKLVADHGFVPQPPEPEVKEIKKSGAITSANLSPEVNPNQSVGV
jgi:hypothetical protein